MCLIYSLTFPNNKKYIGLTMYTIEKRFKEHCRDADNGSEYPVHNAIRKYGKDNIKLEIIDTTKTYEELQKLEQKYIFEYDTLAQNGKGYNQTIGGDGTIGYKFNSKQRENASNAQKKRAKENVECFKKVSEGNKLYNQLHPEKAQNHSEFMKKRLEDPNLRKDHSEKIKNLYKNEPERIKKMSDMKIKLYEKEPERKKKASDMMINLYKENPELKQIISNKVKDIWKTPEYKQKIIDKKKERYSHKPFYAINIITGEIVKDEQDHIKKFTYIPDCGEYIFKESKKYNSNIGAVLKGNRKVCNNYTFKYDNNN
jgi:group I intron endonuclease